MTPTSVVDANSEGGSSSCGGIDGGVVLKKGPWTAEEDAILVDYVKKHGEGNWNAVQRNSGLARCGKSCRLRWANHLRPNLKKGAFSPEEERLIVELHAKYGNKWARMASLLPGRTDNEIKNYWNTRVKRHQRQGLPLYPADLQPQQPPSSHGLHHQSFCTSPSSFSFQTQLTSPTTGTYFSHHQPNQTASSTPPPPPLSPLSSPSATTLPNSFTFQTQQVAASPGHGHNPHLVSPPNKAPISPISPLSSPSTNTGYPNLSLFDFSIPRTPPILQTPLRFKRFNSAPDITPLQTPTTTNNNIATSFSLPLTPLTIPNAASNMGHGGGGQVGCSFTGLLSTNSSDFHKNLQEENQKMCSLFAAVSQPELPSSQLQPNSNNTNTTNNMNNVGIGVGGKFGRRMHKKKNGGGICKEKDNRGLALVKNGNGLLEDLLREAKVLTANGETSRDDNSLLLQDQNQKMMDFEGFCSHWDNSSSLPLSSGLESKVEAVAAQPTSSMTSEDLSKLLDNLPSSIQVEFTDGGDISNGPSSVITDDNIGFDMQQIASLFPTTADHERTTLGSYSWDNLPRIC